jgi:hypothetical protein
VESAWTLCIPPPAALGVLRILTGGLLLLLTGCADRPGDPIVDMQGVDPAKFEQDLADCREERKWTLTLGNYMDECLETKGYNILRG